MSDSKVFMFPDNYGGGNRSGNSLDPNLLLALNSGGGFGGNGNWMWVLFLFFLFPLMRNFGGMFGGNGNGGFQGFYPMYANNDAARELFMQGINGNREAINQLSNMLGCKLGDVQNAINSLMSQIQNVGNQVGMGTQQIINAVQAGNTQLGMQIAQCCCDMKGQLASCCCDIQRDIAANTAANTRGFADLGYALRDQTCNIEKAIENSTSRILDGQRAAEMREMQNKIDALREKNSQKDVIINNAQQTQAVGQMIAQATQPIYGLVTDLKSELDGIKCKLPETVNLPYSPAVAVPRQQCLTGLGLGFGLGCGFGIDCNNSLWG